MAPLHGTEWTLRVRGTDDLETPELSVEAFEWWRDWCTRVRRGSRAVEPVAPGDIFEVARRTVTPGNPAAHRKYWRESLPRPAYTLVDEVTRRAQIARRTVFARLRAGTGRLPTFVLSGIRSARLPRFFASKPLHAFRQTARRCRRTSWKPA